MGNIPLIMKRIDSHQARRILTILICLIVTPLVGLSQITDSTTIRVDQPVGVFPKKPESALYRFKVGGFYRFFSTYTDHQLPYVLDQNSGTTVTKRNLFIGDDSQLPNVTLNFSGRPTTKTSWGFDLYVFQFLEGTIQPSYGLGQVAINNRPSIFDPLSGTRLGGNLGLLLGVNMYADYKTNKGSIGVKTGGIHWVSLSDLTLAAFTGYNRFTLFERNPWDPIGSRVVDRYENFYAQGNINQDTRWGERAFVGTIVEASDIWKGINLTALYGKTELNGGFLTIPNLSYGGRLHKAIGAGHIALNNFNSRTFTDSLTEAAIGFNVVTTEFKTKIARGINLSGEVGMGRYYSPSHDLPWGEALSFKLNLTDDLVKWPTEVHFFRVSPDVINNNAIYWNSSIIEEQNNTIPAGSVGSTALLAPFASSLTAIGQFTNNRQGLNINTELKLKDLKLSIANGISSELEGLSNHISFNHPVNQLTRSRMWRWNFPQNVGPYNRYNVIFRDAYERMEVKDTMVAKKFNTIEIQAKYKTRLRGRKLYLFMLNRYSSVQDYYSLITVFNEKAYLRHYTTELETYFEAGKKTFFTGYLGYERILGNYRTETDVDSRRPRNQEGWGVGIGIDHDIARNTALYVRHRWFAFKDHSFIQDQFEGTETIVELKFSF